MAGRSVISKKRVSAPEWVFAWRFQKPQWVPRLMAVVVAGAVFACLLTVVRIRVVAPERLPARKASLIYLTDDASGRALSLRAREGGPFPSRFELKEWKELGKIETAALAATKFIQQPYVPAMSDLPDADQVTPMKLAAMGESFFPTRAGPVFKASVTGASKLAPELYPLDGISEELLPEVLPPFDAALDAFFTSSNWRFLVCLDPEGGVTECVSLERADERRAAELEAWLQNVQFRKNGINGKPQWVSIGIQFTNQLAHGPDAR
jgi:hypothetical protein